MSPAELVVFAEELARIAATGAGARALADHLARRAGVGVLVEDAEWRHLAVAGKTAVPSSVRTLLPETNTGAYSPLRNGYAGRTISMYAGESRLGQLSVFGERDLDEIEFTVRLTAGTIAVELAREHGTQPGRRRVFWDRLCARSYIDAAAARDDAAARGITPATHYVAVALEAEGADESTAAGNQTALRAAAAESFKSGEGDVGTVERGGTLVYLLPAAREIDAANARTAATLLPRALAKKHPQLKVGGGVGRRVALVDAGESLAQAQSALTISRRMYGPGCVAVYDDLGIYPLLLGGAPSQTLREFAVRTLAPLRTYDEKHQTELERTLRLYFSVGENVKTAALELNVHRHTVFYRLRQIGEICRCDLNSPHDQLTLRTAIAIDGLTG